MCATLDYRYVEWRLVETIVDGWRCSNVVHQPKVKKKRFLANTESTPEFHSKFDIIVFLHFILIVIAQIFCLYIIQLVDREQTNDEFVVPLIFDIDYFIH
jgi:hypothetical protein